MSIMISLMIWSKIKHYIVKFEVYSFPCFISFDPYFKHNRYNTSDFSPEQTRPQNAGTAGKEFVSRDKKFLRKIDTNLASWHTFLRQILVN